MAPVVYLPGFTDDKPFNMEVKKTRGPRGMHEAASEFARDTPITSPSPHHAVKTPCVLWPQTPEPMDPDFAFFFPMQGPEEAIATMGQNIEVPRAADAAVGLPLQVLHSEIVDSSFNVDSYSSEGDEFGFSQLVDTANFTFGPTEYEDNHGAEQPFEFAPMMTANIAAFEQPAIEKGPNALDGKELMHENGQCRPCAWFWKKEGCKNGLSCGYCHLCPPGELKNRKKQKVLLMRSGALDPQKSSARSGTGRQLRLDPLVSNTDV
mmetsp:Transcript_53722/g.94226  ORF Transcript_53722/g.94226 Transcript_53722/m.94226 type:complete len:264 (-) Transcript_53722:226-1017(-)